MILLGLQQDTAGLMKVQPEGMDFTMSYWESDGASGVNQRAPTSANKSVAACAHFVRSGEHGAERRAGNA